jgi:hypothetical protein
LDGNFSKHKTIMKTFKLISVALVLLTILYGCDKIFLENLFGKNEELSFVRTDYNGKELRTDGYYSFQAV